MSVRLMARLLAGQWVRGALYWMVRDREYKGGHLYSEEGDLYMGRWAVIDKGGLASRVLSFLTGGMYDHVRLHCIMVPDRDRELHDHPFNYRTFVLDGWYTEEYIDALRHPGITGHGMRHWQGSRKSLPHHAMLGLSQRRLLKPGDTAHAPIGQFHRIAQVADGGVWTLFAMGGDSGKWGFLVDGRWVKSHDFFKLRSINRDGTRATN